MPSDAYPQDGTRYTAHLSALPLCIALCLGFANPAHPNDATFKVPLRPDRRTEPGVWTMRIDVPLDADWLPASNWRPMSITDSIRGADKALDGRLVHVFGDAVPVMVVDGKEQFIAQIGPLHLLTTVTGTEACAGPIKVAVPGRNTAGDYSVVQLEAEVVDKRWRRRNCRSSAVAGRP